MSIDMAGLGNQSSLPCESSNDENDVDNCSAKLLDLKALDCPICSVTMDIYHVRHACCYKLRNKCPSCALPIGHIRCRTMERVIKAVIVPCPNFKFGCTQKFSYGAESTNEKECTFSLCVCPAWYCNYTGSYKDLFSHFKIHKGEREYSYPFTFGNKCEVYFHLTEYVMKEDKDGLLFVVQCFTEPHGHGVYVIVSCIAPSALEVGEFSCHISTVVGKYNMTFDLPKVKRIRKLNFQTPEEDFMLVPTYFLLGRQALKLRLCISKLNQE